MAGRNVVGWVAVLLSIVIASFWAYWGAIENFHEGWYHQSFLRNAGLAMIQYLLWPLLLAGMAVLGVYRPRVGGLLFIAVGIAIDGVLFQFQKGVAAVLILTPCLTLGTLFYFGRVPKPKLAAWLLCGLPAGIILAISIPMYWIVCHRITAISDAPLSWTAGGKTLVWAPPGPGWPKDGGMSLADAADTCARLDDSGKNLLTRRVGIWRLPTVEEAIEAQNRGGVPAGCRYAGLGRFPPCEKTPDKEGPLWNPYSQVIYWWTASVDAQGRDLRVAYNGYVLPARDRANYTGFRAVK